jgi:hypothetical protein
MGLSVLSILRLTINVAADSHLSFPIKELINRFHSMVSPDSKKGNGTQKAQRYKKESRSLLVPLVLLVFRSRLLFTGR